MGLDVTLRKVVRFIPIHVTRYATLSLLSYTFRKSMIVRIRSSLLLREAGVPRNISTLQSLCLFRRSLVILDVRNRNKAKGGNTISSLFDNEILRDLTSNPTRITNAGLTTLTLIRRHYRYHQNVTMNGTLNLRTKLMLIRRRNNGTLRNLLTR